MKRCSLKIQHLGYMFFYLIFSFINWLWIECAFLIFGLLSAQFMPWWWHAFALARGLPCYMCNQFVWRFFHLILPESLPLTSGFCRDGSMLNSVSSAAWSPAAMADSLDEFEEVPVEEEVETIEEVEATAAEPVSFNAIQFMKHSCWLSLQSRKKIRDDFRIIPSHIWPWALNPRLCRWWSSQKLLAFHRPVLAQLQKWAQHLRWLGIKKLSKRIKKKLY